MTAVTQDPWAVLGVSREAGEDELRQAYLGRVREHPPDRSPAEFERVRDAYELLCDPGRRLELRLSSERPDAPMVSLLDEDDQPRNYVGPGPWLDLLRKRRR